MYNRRHPQGFATLIAKNLPNVAFFPALFVVQFLVIFLWEGEVLTYYLADLN
jgi:hypothetical protein